MENTIINKIQEMAANVDKSNIDELGDFGLNVYSLLIGSNYIRKNLTVTSENVQAKSPVMKSILEALLIVRNEYNEILTEDNIDNDTEDFSDNYFGTLVLESLKTK